MSTDVLTTTDSKRTYGPVTLLVLTICWVTVVAD